MAGRQGHGFAGEKINHLYDTFTGQDAKIIGSDNAKNGADRLVDGINIQTKYCATGSRCINECFDETTKQMRYINPDGTPMQIEVPSDKYDDAIRAMEHKISNGQVPGVTDPQKANEIVRKGKFTYQQAVNVAKFGTIESLTYDAINGVKLAGISMGISSALSFSIAVWNGKKWEEALKDSVYSGLKVGGVAWAGSIVAAQLGRTGMEQALRGATDYLVKNMGSKAYHLLANALRSSDKFIYGAAAMNHASKLLRGNVVTGVATTLVLSTADFYRLFNGRVSGTQVFKNVTKIGASVAGGIGGWMGGAAAGGIAGSAIPVVGNVTGAIIGGIVGSLAGGTASHKATEIALDHFIEDDAIKMMKILEEEFSSLAFDYLLNEKEAEIIIDKFKEKDIPDILRDMFASNDRRIFAQKLFESDIIETVKNRKKIVLPTSEELIQELGEVLEEIDDIRENLPICTNCNTDEYVVKIIATTINRTKTASIDGLSKKHSTTSMIKESISASLGFAAKSIHPEKDANKANFISGTFYKCEKCNLEFEDNA
ncbi:MAG: hypothetical protein JXA94_02105 [Parachlamydiales bacterium]|nr:hypothetical protein [Parachlamydiales bacterium]